MTNDADESATQRVASSPPGRGWWIPAVLAAGLTFTGALWVGLAANGLAQASIIDADRVYRVGDTLSPWLFNTSAIATGLALFTGHRRTPVGPCDGTALVGAVWTAGWVSLLSFPFTGVELNSPDDVCRHPSCWPLPYQGLSAAAPAIIGALVLALMATLGRRAPWVIRAAVPAVVFLVLSVVQRAIWESVAIPFFTGPPPF